MVVPANYYDKGIKTNILQFLWHTHRYRIIKNILPKSVKKVLDIGCHGGNFTEKIFHFLPMSKMWAVDVDKKSIAYAKKIRPQFNFQVSTAEKLPFKNNSFDLITCLEVLEHLKNPKKAIGEMRRCLKKEGRLVVLVPTESKLFKLIWYFWTKSKGKVWDHTHIQNFNGNKLDKMLLENGFVIEKRNTSHLDMLLAIKARKK